MHGVVMLGACGCGTGAAVSPLSDLYLNERLDPEDVGRPRAIGTRSRGPPKCVDRCSNVSEVFRGGYLGVIPPHGYLASQKILVQSTW